MSEIYIKQKDALDIIITYGRAHEYDDNPCIVHSCANLERQVNAIPAADVRPVVRGKWIQTTQPMGWRDEDCAECSVCGEDFVLDEWAMDEFTNLMNFCPNCGADMREDKRK